MDNKYDLSDLVVSAIEQKPLDFETAFNDLIVDRIRGAVEDKKIAIAQQMYNYNPEDVADAETEEEIEDNSEEETNDEES
ncbi:MAG: hypothetical protein [Caudoviricetes sp.]|jgi:hypothetical protein|nr:MAG: hypothetical protein [Caudoviricetes sp.]